MTEEAVYNATLLRATTVQGVGVLEAIPIDKLRAILSKHGISPPTPAGQ